MLPIAKSGKWFLVFFVYTVVIFVALLISRALLGNEVLLRNIVGMLVLSVSSASLPSIAGYFGKRLFFAIFTIASILGLLYAYYVIIGDIAPGWSDLTSIIGYLFIVGLGTLLGIIAELIAAILKLSRNKK